MKFRRILTVFCCVAALLTVTACGGAEETGGETEQEETEEPDGEDEVEEIVITGPEWESGDLTINVPDEWEVSLDDCDWASNDRIKVLESANMQDTGGTIFGDAYVDIQLSDFSEMSSAYSEDACENAAVQYDDEDARPKEYPMNENRYLGYRNYGYAGDSAVDWAYLAYTADGRLIEIRAYIKYDVVTEKNQEAIRSLLASLKIGGQPVSVVP